MISTRSGFSMVSILIAIVLLAMGVMALSRASAEVFRAHTTSGGRTQALAIARGHMELVRSQPPVDLASEGPVRVDESGVADPAGPYTRSVEVEDVRHNLKRIKVTVAFPRAEQPVEIVTFAFVGNVGN
jgi:type IV pilus assembly protein PilV